MMPRRNQLTVQRSNNVLDGRAGYRIRAQWGHVGVLEGGGHICELALNSVPGVNPLWKPQWTTIDPDRYSARNHRAKYGPPPDGKLLAGIAGHSLSFDHFGPPSKEEIAAGLSTHGEAPSIKWRRQPSRNSPHPSFRYGCGLPEAQIHFSRSITLDQQNAVVYCEEEARNLTPFDRPVSWNEHVTFGPPFLECGVTVFDMPATRAKVCPPQYSDKIFLQPDADFDWPNAPAKDRSQVDLRTTPDECFGHYTAQLLDPELDIGFISACNPRQGLLVVYAFRRAQFPWVGNWEERNHRKGPPWNGRTFCRGIEFSTTPFAIPRRESIDQGRLFGERTYGWLPARSTVRVRFIILLFRVPQDFGPIQKFALERGRATVTDRNGKGYELSVPVKDFLRESS